MVSPRNEYEARRKALKKYKPQGYRPDKKTASLANTARVISRTKNGIKVGQPTPNIPGSGSSYIQSSTPTSIPGQGQSTALPIWPGTSANVGTPTQPEQQSQTPTNIDSYILADGRQINNITTKKNAFGVTSMTGEIKGVFGIPQKVDLIETENGLQIVEGGVPPIITAMTGGIGKLGKIFKTTEKAAEMKKIMPWFDKISDLNKFIDSEKAATTIADVGKAGANTKVAAKSMSYADKVVKAMKAPKVVGPILAAAIAGGVGASLYSYPWTAHLQIDNVMPIYSMAANDLRELGRDDLADEVLAARDDFLNRTESFAANIPGWNVIWQKKEDVKATILTQKAIDQAQKDIKEGVYDSVDDKWAKIREEQASAEKEAVDYYNEQLRITNQLKEEARIAGDKEAAKIWIEKEKEIAKIQKETARYQANYWLEYKKKVLELEYENAIREQELYEKSREEAAPSKLNFGII